MNIRLISGKFGKRVIKAPDGNTTHPMSERVRGALFNIIRPRLFGAEVLDVFAGSGSIGFEALSHGAAHVCFVEKDSSALEAIKSNIKTLSVENTTLIYNGNVAKFVKEVGEPRFDVIIADPPYDNMQLSTVSGLTSLLKPKGLMVLSYPGKGEVPQFNEFVVVDNRSYGNAALAFYQRK